MGLRTEILKVDRLSQEQIQGMFSLFSQYYVDVSFEHFKSDLKEKTHVFYFSDDEGLAGFSTIFRKKMPGISNGLILFSGDTVTKQKYWGTKILQKAFFIYIVASKLRSPFRPVYWMLMSKGFKTYLMMRKNFGLSYPMAGRATPPRFLEAQKAFYAAKFPGAYDSRSQLISFGKSLGAVKGQLADPTLLQLRDPDVRAFMKLNPEYKFGVELACIAEIRFTDFFFHVAKYFIPKPALRVIARLRPTSLT